jgi:hypothetical protein
LTAFAKYIAVAINKSLYENPWKRSKVKNICKRVLPNSRLIHRIHKNITKRIIRIFLLVCGWLGGKPLHHHCTCTMHYHTYKHRCHLTNFNTMPRIRKRSVNNAFHSMYYAKQIEGSVDHAYMKTWDENLCIEVNAND